MIGFKYIGPSGDKAAAEAAYGVSFPEGEFVNIEAGKAMRLLCDARFERGAVVDIAEAYPQAEV